MALGLEFNQAILRTPPHAFIPSFPRERWIPIPRRPTMSRRSRAREVVLQVLYQDDLNPDHDLRDSDNFLRARLKHQTELVDFALGLLRGTRRNRPELDAVLVSRADNWSLRRMAATDRNILRPAAFELLYTETPGRVVINEAVELAKRFGSKQSAQFVNGVLDGLLSQKSRDEERPASGH